MLWRLGRVLPRKVVLKLIWQTAPRLGRAVPGEEEAVLYVDLGNDWHLRESTSVATGGRK